MKDSTQKYIPSSVLGVALSSTKLIGKRSDLIRKLALLPVVNIFIEMTVPSLLSVTAEQNTVIYLLPLSS